MPDQSVGVPTILMLKNVQLRGDLIVPQDCLGLVLFSHGSGSCRQCPRSRAVARVMHRSGLGTLLFDLLTPDEERADEFSGHFRFDIRLLSRRLIEVTKEMAKIPAARDLPIAYFGAGTGAASALVAAAELPDRIKSVVSRGGRPDLAAESLPRVRAPTLFIVGGEDSATLALNRMAMTSMKTERRIEVVPGATQHFDEIGALEEVARMATRWLARNFHVSAHTDLGAAC